MRPFVREWGNTSISFSPVTRKGSLPHDSHGHGTKCYSAVPIDGATRPNQRLFREEKRSQTLSSSDCPFVLTERCARERQPTKRRGHQRYHVGCALALQSFGIPKITCGKKKKERKESAQRQTSQATPVSVNVTEKKEVLFIVTSAIVTFLL